MVQLESGNIVDIISNLSRLFHKMPYSDLFIADKVPAFEYFLLL